MVKQRLKNPVCIDRIEFLKCLGEIDICERRCGWKISHVVGGVVSGLRHDDRVLGRFENPSFGCRSFLEHCLEICKVDVGCRCRQRLCYPDLHDGAGVGTVAGLRGGRTAGIRLVRGACEVVIDRDARRESRRGIVVENERLAVIGAEINHDIGPFCCSQKKGMLIDVSVIEGCRVEVPADGLAGYHGRCR